MALSMENTFSDSVCNLECVGDSAPIQEFVGTVKIILIDPPKAQYRKIACLSAFIGLAHMLMAVTIFTILFYTLAFKTSLMMNLHIVLCTIGYQLFFPSAILMTNYLHGPSSKLKERDRQHQHIILQVLGIVCGAIGSVMVFMSTEFQLSSHCMIGLATGALSGITAFLGPIVYFSRNHKKTFKVFRLFHTFFGILTFFASSLCFTIGIYLSATFTEWAVFLPDLLYILIVFCAFYTFVILTTPIMKLFGCPPEIDMNK